MTEKKDQIHKLKKGDTIESLVLELGISPEEVRGFHNIHSKDENLIIYDLPIHLTELLVYPHIREIKKENYPTAQFSGYTLSFKPNPKKVNYGVMFTITNNETEITTIKFDVSIIFLENQNENFVYEITKFETYINDIEVDSMIDKLAETITKVIYPLQIITNQQNKFIGIANFDQVKKRWKTEKEKTNEYFDGDWFYKFQEISDRVFKNQSTLMASLSNDWFLNSFFSGIHTNYTQRFKFENTITFPLLTNTQPLQYKVTQIIDEYLDEFSQVIIDQEGQLDDQRNKANFNTGQLFSMLSEDDSSEKAEGKFKAKYFLNSKDNSIESLFLTCDIILDKPKNIEIIIAKKLTHE